MIRLWALVVLMTVFVSGNKKHKYPNVVVIVADDLGFGDVGCYGNDTMNTPNIDKLASEGVKLTHHLAAATLCTPSRAAMLTGRYPARYGLVGEMNTVQVITHVSARAMLPLTEVTLARALEAANYTTALIGKWHLGMNCGWLGFGCNGPKMHGFQSFYGIPLTLLEPFRGDHKFWIFDLNQLIYQIMAGSWLVSILTLFCFRWQLNFRFRTLILLGITMIVLFFIIWFILTHFMFHTRFWWRVTPWMNKWMNGILMHEDKVIQQPIQFNGLMQNMLNVSLKFINDHAQDDRPFFLYHSFGHVHGPMYTHPSMAGKSKWGSYGDNVEELDVGVGAIMDAIAEHNLDENTIVYFLSDNGGHIELVNKEGHRTGGHNGLFKGGKAQGGAEGGIRVPGIYRWKGHIPASVTIHEPTSLMDMMPTILDLANLPQMHDLLPDLPHRELDGVSISNLLLRGEPQNPRIFLHHCLQAIHAIRWFNDTHVYKMFIKRSKFPEGTHQCGWGFNLCPCYGESIIDLSDKPMLFELSRDPYESQPIPEDTREYKEVVAYLLDYLRKWRERVPYPPSLYKPKLNAILSIWRQPFCLNC